MEPTPYVTPAAPLAEKSILSVMMQQPDVFIPRAFAEGLSDESFWQYGRLFRAIVDHHAKHGSINGEIETSSFAQALHLAGSLDAVGGPHAVYDVSGAVTGGALGWGGWSVWVGQAREAQARRRARLASQRLAEANDSDEAAAELEAALEAVRKAKAGGHRSKAIREAARDFADALQAAHAAGVIPGGSTGIAELDAISGGMRAGEFWVVGGHTSKGKSVLMIQIAAEFIERAEPVAVFSLEMSAGDVVGRLVSTIGRIDYGAITQPRTASGHDLGKIKAAVGKLAAAQLWIDDTAGMTIDTIRAEAVRLRDLNGGKMGLVVVDYLQICGVDRVKNEMREREVARISGGLKQLAKELKCPVLSASQLNDDGRVRESRAIIQDADAALVIVDDGVKVLKMRHGPRNAVLPLELEGRFQRFTHRQA